MAEDDWDEFAEGLSILTRAAGVFVGASDDGLYLQDAYEAEGPALMFRGETYLSKYELLGVDCGDQLRFRTAWEQIYIATGGYAWWNHAATHAMKKGEWDGRSRTELYAKAHLALWITKTEETR